MKNTELKNKEHKSNKPWQFDLVLKKCKKNKGKKSHESIDESLCLRDDFMLKDFLGVFDYAVEKIMRFELRDTQRVAIMILLVLFNVNTFEKYTFLLRSLLYLTVYYFILYQIIRFQASGWVIQTPNTSFQIPGD